MLTDEQVKKLRETVTTSLDNAENIWKKVEPELILANMSEGTIRAKAATVTTRIPGYETIEEGKPHVDDFIAIVLDIRESSKHLLQAIAGTKASQLQRLFYETSALLPASSLVIGDEQGAVTEFLGDGLLGMFRAAKENQPKVVYHAYDAAENCLDLTTRIVNPILAERYSLPPLKIGIGLAYSQAIVTTVGTDGNLHPKAFGECVWRASKISKGVNQIYADEALQLIWPKTEKGTIRFSLQDFKGVKGYLICKA